MNVLITYFSDDRMQQRKIYNVDIDLLSSHLIHLQHLPKFEHFVDISFFVKNRKYKLSPNDIKYLSYCKTWNIKNIENFELIEQ